MSLPPPNTIGLPFASWRPGQADAIRRALTAPTLYVAIVAPTGSGKSAMACAIALLADMASALLTATKGLQDQYQALKVAPDMRGAHNYACVAARDRFAHDFPDRQHVGCDEGPCMVGAHCELRRATGCHYFDALAEAASAAIVTTNYAYWLSGAPDRLGSRPLLILDEAHSAPEAVLDARTLDIFRSAVGSFPTERAQAQTWRTWAEERLPEATARAEHGSIRERLRYKRLVELLTVVASIDEENWAWEWPTVNSARIAPINAARWTPGLFRGAKKAVLLSATLTERTFMALGIRPDQITWITLPSPFPKRQRPVIVFKPAGRVDFRITEEGEQQWLDAIDALLGARHDRKGLVHTVSYGRQALLVARSRHGERMIVPRRAADLAGALDEFRHAGPGAVLVSPQSSAARTMRPAIWMSACSVRSSR